MAVGAIPADWRTRRMLSKFSLDEPLPFLDVDAPETHTYLTAAMATQLEAFGVPNLDVAFLRGSNRFLMRAIAEWAYVAEDEEGAYLFSGLRYESRLGPHECWALFGGTRISTSRSDAIPKDHPALAQIARMFGLTIH